MNILVVSSYYHPAQVYGGPVPALRHLNQALALSGHRVTTYTTNANGAGDLTVPLGQPVMVDGLPVTYFPRWWFGREQKPRNLFFSPALGRQLRRLQPGDFDLILIHATFCDPERMAAKAAKRVGIPYICYTHGTFEPWRMAYKQYKKKIYMALIEERILRRAAGIVVCNDAETRFLQKYGITAPIKRIPWGIQPVIKTGNSTQQVLEEYFPALQDRPYILFLSRVHRMKGLDLLVPAFAKVAERFSGWVLVIAGPDEGGYKQIIEKMVENYNLGNQVLFTGLVEGKKKSVLLENADLYVLPSYSEGFSVSVVEALGYGRPAVITTSCYVPEVAEKQAGLIVPPDQDALMLALEAMMGNDDLRRSCGQNALLLAQQYFTWEAVAKGTEAFYQKVGRSHSIA
jgi:glycosyltransferase involved in cell wall biosynthesis